MPKIRITWTCVLFTPIFIFYYVYSSQLSFLLKGIEKENLLYLRIGTLFKIKDKKADDQIIFVNKAIKNKKLKSFKFLIKTLKFSQKYLLKSAENCILSSFTEGFEWLMKKYKLDIFKPYMFSYNINDITNGNDFKSKDYDQKNLLTRIAEDAITNNNSYIILKKIVSQLEKKPYNEDNTLLFEKIAEKWGIPDNVQKKFKVNIPETRNPDQLESEHKRIINILKLLLEKNFNPYYPEASNGYSYAMGFELEEITKLFDAWKYERVHEGYFPKGFQFPKKQLY